MFRRKVFNWGKIGLFMGKRGIVAMGILLLGIILIQGSLAYSPPEGSPLALREHPSMMSVK